MSCIAQALLGVSQIQREMQSNWMSVYLFLTSAIRVQSSMTWNSSWTSVPHVHTLSCLGNLAHRPVSTFRLWALSRKRVTDALTYSGISNKYKGGTSNVGDSFKYVFTLDLLELRIMSFIFLRLIAMISKFGMEPINLLDSVLYNRIKCMTYAKGSTAGLCSHFDTLSFILFLWFF